MMSMCRRYRFASGELPPERRRIAAATRRWNSPSIVPIMLTLFFGVVEFSSGVAVDRKVTLVARTLSDLTSQSSR